ncbi:MAG: methyl-accepting chemotaxis protein, partial [Candidatus Syntropharchaeia archaeon]
MMGIKAKFLITGVLPITILWIVGLYVLYNIGTLNEYMDVFSKIAVKAMEISGDIERNALRVESSCLSYIISRSENDGKILSENLQALGDATERLKDMELQAFEEKLNRMEDLISQLESQIEGMKGGIERGDEENILNYVEQMKKTVFEILAVSTDIKKIAKEEMQKAEVEMDNMVDKTRVIQAFVPPVILGISVVFIVMITTGMFRMFKPLMIASKRLQDNDLTFKFEKKYTGKDEISRLMESFRVATTTLKNNMANVLDNAEEVATEINAVASAMEEIAQNINTITNSTIEISSKTESISANVEEVTAGAEELSAASKSIANDAQEAATFSSESSELAQEGGK